MIFNIRVEAYVLKVFQSVGVNLVSYDLVAVHRMGKFVQGKTRTVIVRFVNRKNAFCVMPRNLRCHLHKNSKGYTLSRTCVHLIKKSSIIYIN